MMSGLASTGGSARVGQAGPIESKCWSPVFHMGSGCCLECGAGVPFPADDHCDFEGSDAGAF